MLHNPLFIVTTLSALYNQCVGVRRGGEPENIGCSLSWPGYAPINVKPPFSIPAIATWGLARTSLKFSIPQVAVL